MRLPFSPFHLIAFIIASILVIIFIQLGLISIVFTKLGLSTHSALLLLMISLFGSAINVPLYTLNTEDNEHLTQHRYFGLLRTPGIPFTGQTWITINVGGGLTPCIFSAYLISIIPIPGCVVLSGIAMVSLISYISSRPVPGVGIGMPIFIAPITAALVGLLLSPAHSAPLAYISGTLGVLTGADLLRLKDIRRMGTPLVSIGGAGTFDGIFITGMVAVLLA